MIAMTLATSFILTGFVVHVNKVDSIDCDSDDVGSLLGGADNKEVRMEPSVLDVCCGAKTTSEGELSGVLSKSLGDKESMLSMPLSCSK